MPFNRKINRLSQFPTARGQNAHKLKELLLKMSVDAERSPELAEQCKGIIDTFMSQYEDEQPVKKNPVKKPTKQTKPEEKQRWSYLEGVDGVSLGSEALGTTGLYQ